MTLDDYETMLKLMDEAGRTCRNAGKAIDGLDNKLVFHKLARVLDDARIAARSGYYTFEDAVKAAATLGIPNMSDHVEIQDIGSQPCPSFSGRPTGPPSFNVHECPNCGKRRWFCDNCCADHAAWDGNPDCHFCCGDGWVCGERMGDPLMYDRNETYRCPCCHGSGLAKDCTFW